MSGHDNEIPFDPDSPIFSNENVAEQAFGGLDYATVDEAIALPELHQEYSATFGDIASGESMALVGLVESYGLPAENVARLAALFTHSDRFTFISSPIGNQAFMRDAEAFVVDTETGRTDVYIAPNMVGNFITDAMHTIEPIDGNEEIAFARDVGVKMACVYALTILCFEVLRQQTEGASSQQLTDLFEIGHEDVPMLDSEGYADFLPHRMAARLAIDRLSQIMSKSYDTLEGQEAVEKYVDHRRRAFETLKRVSLGRFSMIDMATVLPLSVENTQEFLTVLPGVTRNPHGIELAD